MRGHIENVLKRAVTKAVAAVDEVLNASNASDNCLVTAEKHSLLTKVIEAIYPEGTDGLRIDLKPSFAFNLFNTSRHSDSPNPASCAQTPR